MAWPSPRVADITESIFMALREQSAEASIDPDLDRAFDLC
jgi:hypothetical protein